MLFPVIGFGERESEIRVNFGNSEFRYDIHAHDWTAEKSAAALIMRKFEW